MNYYYIDIMPFEGEVQRHIIYILDGVTVSFPATDDNPNMVEYLAWLAEGNTPEPWNPEGGN